MSIHSFTPAGSLSTPTRLPDAPRTVRKQKSVRGAWIIKVLLTPFVLLGLLTLGYLLLSILCFGLGSLSSGKVTLAEDIQEDGSDTYRLRYTYLVNDRSVTGSHQVDRAYFQKNANWEGCPVQVRYFAFGPLHYSAIADWDASQGPLFKIALFSLVWNGVIFFAIHQVWIGSKRRAEVYRDGEIAFGTVVSRKTVSDENKTYVVTFQFTDKSGEPIVKEQNVRAEAWTAASEGQGITVLYDPDQPLKRSYGYEIGDLEVVGAEPGPKPS